MRRQLTVSVTTLLLLSSAPPAEAYSVPAHEAIIDSAWHAAIRSLLLERFPGLREQELRACAGRPWLSLLLCYNPRSASE